MERKDKILRIRISDSEYEFLRKKAESSNMNVSEFVRDSINSISTNKQQFQEDKMEEWSAIVAKDILSIVLAIHTIINEFDIEKFFEDIKSNQFDKEKFSSDLMRVKRSGKFEILKKETLVSILHDLQQKDEMYKMNKESEKILKEICIEYIRNGVIK